MKFNGRNKGTFIHEIKHATSLVIIDGARRNVITENCSFSKRKENVDPHRFADLDRRRADHPLIHVACQESDLIGLSVVRFGVRYHETGLQLTDLDGQCCRGSVREENDPSRTDLRISLYVSLGRNRR